jgi:trk system potassium uptake protein TrkA
MRIVIVGCGRAGAELAFRMNRAGHAVTIIDQSATSFQNLHPEFDGRTLHGDVLARDVLERSGIEGAEGFAAVTNSDTVNAVAAHVARAVFGVPNVVVRSYATGALRLHEAFGFNVVSSTSWGASRIEALLQQSAVRAVYSAGNGEVELYEIPVGASWSGRPLGELLAGGGCSVAAVTRAGKALLPAPGLALAAGDIVLVGATLAGLETLRRRLAAEGGPPCS